MANVWQAVANIPSGLSPDTMMLLTDGAVFVHDSGGANWFRLTPDAQGNYRTGVWSGPFAMANTRQFFATGVLMDGRVFAIGGEISNAGSPTGLAEIFDPVTNTWSSLNKPSPAFDFIGSDAVSTVLADGRVLLGSPGGPRTALWDPVLGLWTEAGLGFGASGQTKQANTNEETWALLPDGTVLTVEITTNRAAEKYVPALDQWVSAGTTPGVLPIVSLTDTTVASRPQIQVSEIGPAIGLPDGRCFFVGASGRTALYTSPAAPAQAGSWTAGPNFPADTTANNFNSTNGNLQTCIDGPACLLTSGNVLCIAGNTVREVNSGRVGFWSNPANLYVFNAAANTITALTPQPASGNVDVWRARLLPLPTGQVLFSTESANLEILTLDAATAVPNNAWRPTITTAPAVITVGKTFQISGTQFNGLSQAANYGDDAGVSTNYPIVRLTSTTSSAVFYLRSFAFSSMGIATGTAAQSATVSVPPNVTPGSYTMQVIANGIASTAVNVQVNKQRCFMLIERSTFGQGEVQALINLNGAPARIDPALFVVVEGYTPAELGLNVGNLASPPNRPTVGALRNGITFEPSGPVVPEEPSLPNRPQRFTFPYRVVFQDVSAFNFSSPPTELDVAVGASLTAAGSTVNAASIIQLVKNPNPYILHGGATQPWYLSIDVKVFYVKAGQSRFGATLATAGTPRAAATDYVQSVINNLNGDPGSANSIFDSLPLDENAATLALAPTDGAGTRVYNFAVARVRFRDTVPATRVRAFFRMWPAQQTNATYNTNTLYRSASNGAGTKIPLLGVQGDEIMTIPFFATPRINTGSAKMSTQTDPVNVQTINPSPLGGERYGFFGCWLDINQPSELLFPARLVGPNPTNLPDGPFVGMGTLLPIQQLVRSAHQCLITEIAFDPDPIPGYADPSTSDKLAQRNLTFVNVPNPGVADSRRVPQTFEVRPTPASLPADLSVDELMITWEDIPDGSVAHAYLPGTAADEILALASDLYSTHLLTRSDEHTITFPASGVTYLPIPKGTDVNFAGLLTIDLPAGIKKGDVHHATIRQVTSAAKQFRLNRRDVQDAERVAPHLAVPAEVKPPKGRGRAKAVSNEGDQPYVFDLTWRRVLGQFHIEVPVSTKALLLADEARQLSVMRWIQSAIPVGSRWFLVFQRYVEQLVGRVREMGGDPDKVVADPDGNWQHTHDGDGDDGQGGDDDSGDDGHRDDDRGHRPSARHTGKIVGLVHNRYGEFDGFTLDTERELRWYEGAERAMADLATWAWRDRITVTVHADATDPDRPLRIVLNARSSARRD